MCRLELRWPSEGPREEQAYVLLQLLDGAVGPSEALRAEPGEGRRNQPATERLIDIHRRVPDRVNPDRDLRVFSEAPLRPTPGVDDGLAADDAHRPDDQCGIALVERDHSRMEEEAVLPPAPSKVGAVLPSAVRVRRLHEAHGRVVEKPDKRRDE